MSAKAWLVIHVAVGLKGGLLIYLFIFKYIGSVRCCFMPIALLSHHIISFFVQKLLILSKRKFYIDLCHYTAERTKQGGVVGMHNLAWISINGHDSCLFFKFWKINWIWIIQQSLPYQIYFIRVFVMTTYIQLSNMVGMVCLFKYRLCIF